ncbi:TIGR03943 family putative permease subunit [Microbacterium indicum]|uniref:TIGR03943 family putative permease subunit n=1 Tax=Microbacterium indicum TaxID=358100 RepID=UPI000408A36F|nr:TIGR03943 family protein [Microbacterium indicum]
MSSSAWNRWLGVGIASLLAALTVALTATGRLQLYINPGQAWFACGMAVLLLAGSIASFLLPLREEHEHDHGHEHGSPSRVGAAAAVAGGVVASIVAAAAVALPPATLSAEVAMDRDTGTPPLFAGADDVELGEVDTSDFGVGDWAAVFATATNPDRYLGAPITLTGFVTPGSDGSIDLSRLVITHCVIDAQPANLPIAGEEGSDLETGQWVEIAGQVGTDAAGSLVIDAATLTAIDEPEDPYEY